METARFRMVDDETEGMANMATWSTQRTQTDNIDTMVFMIISMQARGLDVLMWKRDFRKAFRNIPIRNGEPSGIRMGDLQL